MAEKNYLLKVIAYSSVPKIITVVLTLISFPLMIRSIGTSDYGLYVYLLSIIAIFESFIDFGISSAAGRAIAREREKSHNLKIILLDDYQIPSTVTKVCN